MTSNDLETRDKAILDAIAKLSSDLNGKMDKLEKDVTEIKIGQAELKAEIAGTRNELKAEIAGTRNELKAEIKALDNKMDGIEGKLTEKIDGINTRVSNLEFLSRVGISSLIAGIVALIVKIFI